MTWFHDYHGMLIVHGPARRKSHWHPFLSSGTEAVARVRLLSSDLSKAVVHLDLELRPSNCERERPDIRAQGSIGGTGFYDAAFIHRLPITCSNHLNRIVSALFSLTILNIWRAKTTNYRALLRRSGPSHKPISVSICKIGDWNLNTLQGVLTIVTVTASREQKFQLRQPWASILSTYRAVVSQKKETPSCRVGQSRNRQVCVVGRLFLSLSSYLEVKHNKDVKRHLHWAFRSILVQ